MAILLYLVLNAIFLRFYVKNALSVKSLVVLKNMEIMIYHLD